MWTFHDDEPVDGVALTYVRMDEPSLAELGFNWLVPTTGGAPGAVERVLATDTRLVLRFIEAPQGTTVQLTQSGLPEQLISDMSDWWAWHLAICNSKAFLT